MYLTCLAQQVDVICGDAKPSRSFRTKTHKTERTESKGNVHPEPFNGLVITVARVEVSSLNRDQPLYDLVCMEHIDNNAYDIPECTESEYDVWDCCFVQLLSYGLLRQAR